MNFKITFNNIVKLLYFIIGIINFILVSGHPHNEFFILSFILSIFFPVLPISLFFDSSNTNFIYLSLSGIIFWAILIFMIVFELKKIKKAEFLLKEMERKK